MVVSKVIQFKSSQVCAIILTASFVNDFILWPLKHCDRMVQSQSKAPHSIISNGSKEREGVIVLLSSELLHVLLIKLICGLQGLVSELQWHAPQ